ncbi:MAG: hypothetical protein AAB131_18840 [Actinomycetota bacterium]|jgi:cytochrome b561|nr:MAG: hypothetical protein FD127_1411 [Acidimicrobiaceae bacterium]
MSRTSPAPQPGSAHDPIRARRAQIAHWTLLANRVGYLFFALAIVGFVLASAFGFTNTMATIVIASLVIGSILLAPAIVLGYAVKAAERDDRERGF